MSPEGLCSTLALGYTLVAFRCPPIHCTGVEFESFLEFLGGVSWVPLGRLWTSWVTLGARLRSLWGALGALGQPLGDPWRHFGLTLLILASSWPLLGCTWHHFDTFGLPFGSEGSPLHAVGQCEVFFKFL